MGNVPSIEQRTFGYRGTETRREIEREIAGSFLSEILPVTLSILDFWPKDRSPETCEARSIALAHQVVLGLTKYYLSIKAGHSNIGLYSNRRVKLKSAGFFTDDLIENYQSMYFADPKEAKELEKEIPKTKLKSFKEFKHEIISNPKNRDILHKAFSYYAIGINDITLSRLPAQKAKFNKWLKLVDRIKLD